MLEISEFGAPVVRFNRQIDFFPTDYCLSHNIAGHAGDESLAPGCFDFYLQRRRNVGAGSSRYQHNSNVFELHGGDTKPRAGR